MQLAGNRVDFLNHTRVGAVWARVPTSSITDYVNALSEDMKSRGLDRNQISNVLEQNLRAICTVCCCRIPYSVIGDVWMTSTFGRERTTFTNYGPVSRMLDGLCPNQQCKSRELRLVWKEAEYFLELLQDHSERIRTDAQHSRDTSRLACLASLSQPSVVAFATDSLWALTLASVEQHYSTLDTWHSFPDLCVWVTTIDSSTQQAKGAFPSGYLRTFESHLRDVGYKQGEFAFAHWIYTFQMSREGVSGAIHLALVPKHSLLTTDKRFLICPTDLLTEGETWGK